MKWAILLGSPDISGGSYVIFEHAIRAVRRGIDVTIVTEDPVESHRLNWHAEARELSWKTFDEVGAEMFDIAVATWWRTVYELHRVPAHRYTYFVQSIESFFYPEEEESLRKLVEATYLFGLPIITEATWIRDYLRQHFGTTPQLVHNGIRKDIYTTEGPCVAPREPGQLRILVEGPLKVFFKNVEKTIELCCRSQADEVWLLTSSEATHYPGVHRVFSRVPIFETPNIYRSCDVLVKLSYVEGMFGPPLEMFHCGGTAITYDVTGHDEYIRHGQNALVAHRDDEEQVVAYLNRLKAERSFLEERKAEALRSAAAWPDWETASLRFETAIREIFTAGTLDRETLKLRSEFFFAFYTVAENYRNRYLYNLGVKPSLKNIARRIKSKLDQVLKRN